MNKIPRPGPVSKIGPISTNPNVAQAQPVGTTPALSDNNIQIFTYITKPTGKTDTLYNADRAWARVTLTLTTAGPVAVGQLADLGTLTGGQGMLLQTGVPTDLNIAKGNRVFVVANAVNRVNVVVAPIPWLEVITGCVMAIATAMGASVANAVGRVLKP